MYPLVQDTTVENSHVIHREALWLFWTDSEQAVKHQVGKHSKTHESTFFSSSRVGWMIKRSGRHGTAASLDLQNWDQM